MRLAGLPPLKKAPSPYGAFFVGHAVVPAERRVLQPLPALWALWTLRHCQTGCKHGQYRLPL
ncbi:hypothetical protein PHO31112_03010 [Pandoraea horticolens]|uniref:Uncharacterized protein n=1 Tax=Pandoraea horticolens TaxID=2508298 RepID=A0A5E4W1X5_9BURK|nr:hypothetical protein PHO31112_03010 [Pandoraea horticolens]